MSPYLKKHLEDSQCVSKLSCTERNAWLSFVKMGKRIFGNTRAENYKDIARY